MEKTIDLFEMNRRRERRERFLRLVGMAIFAMVAVSFGNATAPSEINDKLGDAFEKVVKVVKYAATGILAVMFITKIIPAVTGGQKDTNWWELIGIIAAVVVINAAETIFSQLTGKAMF